MKLPETYKELEKFKYNREKGTFRKETHTYYLIECKCCKEEFFGYKNGQFCNRNCSSSGEFNAMYGKKLSGEHRLKLSNKWKDPNSKYNSKEYRDKLNNQLTGSTNPNYKNGITKKKYVLYNTYVYQLNWCEPVRSKLDILEVKCCKCNKWFQPTRSEVSNRLQFLKGNEKYNGEFRFYCSDGCKESCNIYRISENHLISRQHFDRYNLYRSKVYKHTRMSYNLYRNFINPHNKKRGRNKYHLDHIYSIKDGFRNDIEPHIIGAPINLRMLKEYDNINKSDNSEISSDVLLEKYNNFKRKIVDDM